MSVLDSTACISPRLQADVWEQQQHLHVWEQQRRWEQQQEPEQNSLLANNVHGEAASSTDDHGSTIMWDIDGDEEQHQMQEFDPCSFLHSPSRLSWDHLISSNPPELDELLNLEAWISGSDEIMAVRSVPDNESWLLATDDRPCLLVNVDPAPAPVSSCGDAVDLETAVNDLTFVASGSSQWGLPDFIQSNGLEEQNSSVTVDEQHRITACTDHQMVDAQTELASGYEAHPSLQVLEHRWLQPPHELPAISHQELHLPDPSAQSLPTTGTASRSRSYKIPDFQLHESSAAGTQYPHQFRHDLAPQVGVLNTTLSAEESDSSSSSVPVSKERSRSSCEGRWNCHGVCQSNYSTNSSAPDSAMTPVAAAAAGIYHGGMITQLDFPQGVGHMGVETSNAMARLGAAGRVRNRSGENNNCENTIACAASTTANEPQNNGVRMVQLLLACAEAVACRDSRQASILLHQLQHMASANGDSMQRVTACFMEGLTDRLILTGAQPFKSTISSRKPPNESEKQEGFQLIYRASPYVAFGHLAANLAILEAFVGEDAVHIVDLGMTHGLQWPYLIHGLASRRGGPPRLLRITGFGMSTEKMEEAGQALAEIAKHHRVTLEFRVVTESLENLQRSMLELREGEALAVNSALQLHRVVKESRGSLNAVLQSIHELNPKILTIVEQDASHNGPFFLGRFLEALHYYSAIFDSLEAILPRYSPQRVKMERFHFAEEIKNIVSCEGPARVERHERVDQWRRRMSRAGFQPVAQRSLERVRMWLGLYASDGYTLTEEKGCLVLGWKGRSLVAASSWRC